MPNETTTEVSAAPQKAPVTNKPVERAVVAPDGTVTVLQNESQLVTVDVADVDLLLGFSDGSYVVVPNGALDAIGDVPHKVIFNDQNDDLNHLFKMAGVSNHAKAGSLRVVTENIDAAKPPVEQEQEIPAPPAPMVKVGAGNALAGKGPGNGHGEGDGEVPATVTPLTTPALPVYRSGQETQIKNGDFKFPPGGEPNFTAQMYTSSNFKLVPNGRTDLPSGAYNPSLSSDPAAQAVHAEPVNQARVEKIYGTSSNDTIDHNSSFSANSSTWVKVLHLTFNNFAEVDKLGIVLTASQIAKIPGFELAGAGVSKEQGFNNSWVIDMSQHPDYKLNGIDIEVRYTVGTAAAPVDFFGDIHVTGKAELENGFVIPAEIYNQIPLTWRDAVTVDDFTVTYNDEQMMVLPSGGTGYEIFAGDGDDTVRAGAGQDIVRGESGNDSLYGGIGNDLLDGGTGADLLDGGTGTDTSTYASASGGVTVSLTPGLSGFSSTGEASGDTFNSIENIIGSSYNDTLIGDGNVNTLSGGAGNDILEGMGGADTLIGGTGSNTASYEHAHSGLLVSLDNPVINTGDAAGDTFTQIQNLTGSAFNDTLIGNSSSNILNGGSGDDILEGMGSADTLIGGSGSNTASYEHSEAGLTASLDNPGINTGDATGDTYTQIHNLTGSSFNDILTGDSGNNIIYGGTGDDVLQGMAGADSLDGDLGTDTASYANASTFISASLTAGLFAFNSAGDAFGDTYNSIENLFGSDYNDNLIGDNNVNLLSGGTGNDVLEGMGGADTLVGDSGSNTASYEHSSAGLTASLDNPGGFNTNDAAGDIYTQIQNLTGSGYNDILIGDSGANTLSGGNGDDTLEGLAGADSLIGGSGFDTASYVHAGSFVTASLTTGMPGFSSIGDASGDSYAGIENLTGSFYNDTLIGDINANVLNGGGGDDILESMGGADTLIGGTGNNTASYEHSAAGLIVSLTNPLLNTGDAAGNTFTQIQNLTGSAFSDTLYGDGNSNILNGGTGDDILEGMGNADILIGGYGTDTADYTHSNTYVVASLTTGLAGFSSAGDAAGDTFSSIENLTGSSYSDTLIGDAQTNTLIGGLGDDILEGMGGADILDGSTGSNTASYEHGADQGGGTGVTASLLTPAANSGDATGDTYYNIQNLIGSAYNDTLTGDANANIITAGTGNDIISGGAGSDTIYGDAGNDNITDDLAGAARLYGGAGDDTIIFTSDDNQLDIIDGGSHTAGIGDTLVWAYAGSQRVDVNMYSGTINFYGPVSGSYTTFTGIENFTASGSNNAYVYADNNDNIIIGGSTGNDWIDYRYALAGVNVNLTTGVVTGGSGNDTLSGIDHINTGSQYNDILIGNAGNNTIRGYYGSDYIDGKDGVDTWYLDWSGWSITASLMSADQNAAMGIVMTGDAAGDEVHNMENISSGYGDMLYGNALANSLYGRGLLEGFLGSDYINGAGSTATASYANAGNGYLAAQGVTFGNGIGVIANLTTTAFSNGGAVINSGDAAGDTYSSNINNLLGSAFNDTLVGNASVNVLTGGAGNDILEGLAGADVLKGDAGSDTVSYAHANVGVVVDIDNNSSRTMTNDAAGDTFFDIENITGSNFNDSLYGDVHDNVLIGGLGNDLLDGGGGTDTVSYETATGSVTIDLATNTVTGAAGNDTLVSIEKIIGSTHVDTIIGSAGDDVIDGGAGADVINGDAGSDTVSYLSGSSSKTVNLATGFNTDGDTLTSIENIIGSNDASGDVLTGNAADNVIEGALGNDTLDGGANGVAGDTASYAGAASAVVVNLASGTATGGAGNDTLINFENLIGSAYNDTLTGDAGNNSLNGGSGDDLLTGGDGSDILIGGIGNDTVSYASSSSGVTVTINGSGTSGEASGDTLYSVENLIGSIHNDILTGDNSANLIDGGLGDDSINGSGGIDTLTYAGAAGAVTVNLGATGINVHGAAGDDTVWGFENLIGSAFADTLTGDGSSNIIEGGAGADILTGGTGSDTASYAGSSAGVDVSLLAGATNTGGHAGGDTLSGFENLLGSAYNDTLTGDSGNNTLDGGAGDDTLTGGIGVDVLIGGTGNNTASYTGAGSAVTASLTTSTGTQGEANGDTFSSIQNLTGSAYNDTLAGDSNANILNGGLGNDRLDGYNGNDTLDVRAGRDTAYGGNDDDLFLVDAANVANLPTLVQGDGNNSTLITGTGDTVKLYNLGGSYSMSALANVTNSMEILDIRDGASSTLNISSLDVRNFVDGGNASQIWIKADSGDSINISTVAGEASPTTITVSSTATDYIVFNGATQVAQIHWQTG